MDAPKSTEEPQALKEQGETYLFRGSAVNVYGSYLHATYCRKHRLLWLGVLLVILLVEVTVLYYIVNPVDLTDPVFNSGGFLRHRERQLFYMELFKWPILIIVLFCILLLAVPLSRRGCEMGNFAWARLYGWLCGKDRRLKFKAAKKAYFDSFERYPMRASVCDRFIWVGGPDGKERAVAFLSVERAFRANGLVVLETGHKKLPAYEVILDIAEVPKAGREGFFRFLDAQLPADCTCYYLRRAKAKYSKGGTPNEQKGGTVFTHMHRDLLPIGSVVLERTHFPKPFLVYGRKVKDEWGKERDYLLCPYPEGLVTGGEEEDCLYWYADRTDIEKVLFVGYQNRREGQMQEHFRSPSWKKTEWDWTVL